MRISGNGPGGKGTGTSRRESPRSQAGNPARSPALVHLRQQQCEPVALAAGSERNTTVRSQGLRYSVHPMPPHARCSMPRACPRQVLYPRGRGPQSSLTERRIFPKQSAGSTTPRTKMKSIIWMEMLLLGASVLIFRSLWAFLDTLAWASGTVGLAVLLVVGLVAAVVALRRIETLSAKQGSKPKVE